MEWFIVWGTFSKVGLGELLKVDTRLVEVQLWASALHNTNPRALLWTDPSYRIPYRPTLYTCLVVAVGR